MDISKMKVVDLKKELKSRGLNTLGSKNELMERLQEALNDDEGGDALDNDDILDEDAVLADETDEAILEEGNGTGQEDDAALLTPTTLSAPKLTSEKMLQKENNVSLPKKIILNRKVSSTADVLPSTLPASCEVNQLHAKESSDSEGSVKDGKKIVKLGSLSDEERAKLRAEKFGVPLPDSLKKAVRAERFGTTNNNPSIATDKKETDEKLLKRQARFGIVSAEEVDVKKQKRAERFGGISNNPTLGTASTEMDELKRKRAERFGLAKK